MNLRNIYSLLKPATFHSGLNILKDMNLNNNVLSSCKKSISEMPFGICGFETVSGTVSDIGCTNT